MPPAARITDQHVCPLFDGPKPHLGGPILSPGCPTVLIGGLPFFIRHRTAAEIASAKAGDTAQLRDPATDDSRLMKTMDGKLNPAILVTSGTCTHLGCVPVGPAGTAPSACGPGRRTGAPGRTE